MNHTARTRFTELVARQDALIPLTETMLVVAAEEYPHLDIPRYLAALDTLAARGRAALMGDLPPRMLAHRLARFLHDQERFRGNVREFSDPRNSYLNDVLDAALASPFPWASSTSMSGSSSACPSTGSTPRTI